MSVNPKADPRVIEYSKKLINLAISDHNMMRLDKTDFYPSLFKLSHLEEDSKEVLPYRSKIYSSMKYNLIDQFLLRRLTESYWEGRPKILPNGTDYRPALEKFERDIKLISDDSLQTEIPKEIASYFTSDEYLNLEKLVSDEKYFLEKMHQLCPQIYTCDGPTKRIAESDKSLKAISVLSQDQLLKNVDILHRILEKINDPSLSTEIESMYLFDLNGIFTKFLLYHQIRLSHNPEETKLLLQDMYNNSERAVAFNFLLRNDYKKIWYNAWHDESYVIHFDMLGKNDRYLSIALRYLSTIYTRTTLQIKDRMLTEDRNGIKHMDTLFLCIDPLFAPESYDRETFIHRINVLNDLIEKIDTFEEITPESKDYLKKLFNLFLLDHKARMCLGEKKPEKAIKYLHELKEKSKGIFLLYSKDGGRVDKLIEACQSQIAKGEMC